MGACIVVGVSAPRADDLTGKSRLLFTTVQATRCVEGGECVIDLPWNLNIPQFIEVDLTAKRLSTTQASGENRATVADTLRREKGKIVLQGYENGRAFSLFIDEASGMLSAAVAAEGQAVAAFGACTPMSSR
jgi:hypothetical protein